jgi:hypothetical protein
VQHLVLGVNAHINLDLAIAAARMCPGDSIHGLKTDFDLVNQLLTEGLANLQVALADLSPLLGTLDGVLGRLDEGIVGFNVRKARAEAWDAAVLLAHQPPDAQMAGEKLLDRYATGLARAALAPPFPLSSALDLLRPPSAPAWRRRFAGWTAPGDLTDPGYRSVARERAGRRG